jgi:hypothetical protein
MTLLKCPVIIRNYSICFRLFHSADKTSNFQNMRHLLASSLRIRIYKRKRMKRKTGLDMQGTETSPNKVFKFRNLEDQALPLIFFKVNCISYSNCQRQRLPNRGPCIYGFFSKQRQRSKFKLLSIQNILIYLNLLGVLLHCRDSATKTITV